MKLILCYKSNLPSTLCHEGIGNTCRNIANYLKQKGYHVEIWPIAGGDVLFEKLKTDDAVTHIAVAAPFIPVEWVLKICRNFPLIKFAITSHSNVGFLQAESNAIRLMRAYAEIAVVEYNFFAAANNLRLQKAFESTYGRFLVLLPNLYDLECTPFHSTDTHQGGTLRIGSFGALRVQKNFTTAAWAAITLARKLRRPLKYFINVGRNDNNGNVVLNAIKASFHNLPGVQLVESDWDSPLAFRRLLSTMHLTIQPSYTETFSMVTADAIAERVPVVISDAVEWGPHSWKANVDDVEDVARKGRALLNDSHHATEEGYQSLQKYNHSAFVHWQEFLK